ncbi:GntR family transcriptional regulator [Nocardiopsis mangrovi]|uniref:GntR family transcriptional regulator n=1 Tax=Nocardiopsis mangrovi TaxID=1179818 RepID=A0ABV9E490_9ACTN
MTLEQVRTPTKAEAAYEALRDAIRSGDLPPGHRLRLQQTARELGMSLTPVREAIRLLAAHGLVEQQANLGAVVSRFGRDSAEEIYRLRLVLEPMAAELAAERATAEDLAEIGTALDRITRALAADRPYDIPELNAAFHRAVYRAARSPYLLEFIDRLWNGVPFQAISLAGRHETSARQHREILAALRDRNGEQAARLMHAHIAEASAETLRRLDPAQQPRPAT